MRRQHDSTIMNVAPVEVGAEQSSCRNRHSTLIIVRLGLQIPEIYDLKILKPQNLEKYEQENTTKD